MRPLIEALPESICIIQNEAMLSACPHVGETFTDTSALIRGIVACIQDNAAVSGALFGAGTTMQTNVFEACSLMRYLQGDESPEMKMKSIFAIGGAARLLIEHQSYARVYTTLRLKY